MNLYKLVLKLSIASLIFMDANNSTGMQPAPQAAEQVLTLTQDAKVFLFAFILGPTMLLAERVESSSLTVITLEHIPWFGKFVRFVPLVFILFTSLKLAMGDNVPNQPPTRTMLSALSGLMLGWTIAESLLSTGGRPAVESFLKELLDNFKNVSWRAGIQWDVPSFVNYIRKVGIE